MGSVTDAVYGYIRDEAVMEAGCQMWMILSVLCVGVDKGREKSRRGWFLVERHECVEEFCYLGDMMSAGGGTGASSVARIRSGCKSFRVLFVLFDNEGTLPSSQRAMCVAV